MTFLITRALEDGLDWQKKLAKLGHRGVVFPCFEVCNSNPTHYGPALTDALAWADWVALTSKRSVMALPPLPPETKVAAVGPKTAEACRAHLGRLDLMSGGGRARDLALDLLALPKEIRPRRVLFPRGAKALTALPTLLQSGGIALRDVVVYEVIPGGAPDELARLGPVDYILIASPTAAEGLILRFDKPLQVPVLSIGPTSTLVARNLGLIVVGEAKERSLEGLLKSIPEGEK